MARARKKVARKVAKKVAKKRTRPDWRVGATAELVSILACPTATANELGLMCENVMDQIDVAYGFAGFTAAAWRAQPGAYARLDQLAIAIRVELERHVTTIGALLDEMAPLAGDESDHEDLDPVEVLARITPMLESKTSHAGT